MQRNNSSPPADPLFSSSPVSLPRVRRARWRRPGSPGLAWGIREEEDEGRIDRGRGRGRARGRRSGWDRSRKEFLVLSSLYFISYAFLFPWIFLQLWWWIIGGRRWRVSDPDTCPFVSLGAPARLAASPPWPERVWGSDAMGLVHRELFMGRSGLLQICNLQYMLLVIGNQAHENMQEGISSTLYLLGLLLIRESRAFSDRSKITLLNFSIIKILSRWYYCQNFCRIFYIFNKFSNKLNVDNFLITLLKK
jgi:hypothetical protein